MIDFVRLATIPVRRSSSEAVAKLPTMSCAAFLRIPWASNLESCGGLSPGFCPWRSSYVARSKNKWSMPLAKGQPAGVPWVHGAPGLRHGPCPPDVALARVLGGGQGDMLAQPLQALLKGEVAEGDVDVAFFTIDVGGKCLVTTCRSELGLGGRHPCRRVSSLTFALARRRSMPFLDEPLLGDRSPGGRPQPIDHREQAGGLLGKRPVVVLLGQQGHNSP